MFCSGPLPHMYSSTSVAESVTTRPTLRGPGYSGKDGLFVVVEFLVRSSSVTTQGPSTLPGVGPARQDVVGTSGGRRPSGQG